MHSPEGFLRHIETCTAHESDQFIPFYIDSRVAGKILRSTAAIVCKHPSFVDINGEGISLMVPQGADVEARTKAIHEASLLLSDYHGIPLDGEIYGVATKWGEPSLAKIDRMAIPWFGTRGFGVHVNGYVRKADGLYMWIGQRAPDRKVDPNKLDNIIGGGLPFGLSIRANLEKEAWEEAGLSPLVMSKASHVSTIRYKVDKMRGLRDDTLFVFEVELPEDKIPRNTDGEVASFKLWPVHEVARMIHDTDHFKFNCNLVIIDFLLRHKQTGLLESEAFVLSRAMEQLLSDEGKGEEA